MASRLRALAEHAGLRRYFFNTSWMMAEQILRLLAGLAIGIYVARFLGPTRYGLYSYAIAFSGIFAALAKLGLETVVVRDIVNRPERRRLIVGTAFWLKVAGGIGTFLIIVLVLPWTGNDATTNLYILIVAAGIIFQAFEIIDFYFQAVVQAKYSSICKIVQIAVSSVVKLVLIALQADLVWFVAVVLLDQITLAATYAFAGWRRKFLADLAAFDPATAKRLLRDCWPLIISGVAIILYMRIDQVMIKAMLGETEVGIYSAAVRLAEIVYFVPMILAASLFPRMVAARQTSDAAFREATLTLLEAMMILALATAIPLFLLSDWIVWLLFGPAFHGAGAVLRVNAWASIFVFSGIVAQQWTITQNQLWQPMIKALAGAVANILLNLILIPRMGIVGAAVATLVSQAFASVALNLAFRGTRPLFALQARAMVMPGFHSAALIFLGRRTA